MAMVVPSYNHMPYLIRTIKSFHKYSPWLKFIVVDDASPEWDTRFVSQNPDADIKLYRFPKNGGLTRSWNYGYRMALQLDPVPEFLIFGNNDILANDGWWRAMVNTLNRGIHLTGPLSNAAGVTALGKQDVRRYFDDYHVTDDADFNNEVSRHLWHKYGQHHQIVSTPVNGFFMMGKTKTFQENAHSEGNVFQPVIKTMPSGRRNPTPLMTGNEDELQHRWKKNGLRSAISCGSYVFHYRSVARGMKHAKKGWHRCNDFDKPV
jgi:glycosyltransferase involved in cell wall biosynthesis